MTIIKEQISVQHGNIELHNVCEIIEGDGQPGVGISRLPP